MAEAIEAKATATYVRMSPRKVRLVLDTIRGKYADEAYDQLRFTPNHAAAEIAKVLHSAVANAANNYELDTDLLKVVRCYVDCGPTMKRVQPRAQGRAYRILKRTSHITVVVAEGTERPRKTGKKPAKAPLRAALPTPVAAAKEEAPVAEEVVEETPAVVEETVAEETTPEVIAETPAEDSK
jgi:large subunit ribosomal protein L22